ncbi:cyclodeaminase/cyclohydrolase family protein [Nocardioides sp.]|uniref:cyclodeaminase/cyclohydrolase family protein n=1 Tax=Nocardioides sp. TaxID=35761 RepID=UPI00261AE1F9|nr:cyclodeaminase/cyclohydrolase family protein [Nocardioides sp.]
MTLEPGRPTSGQAAPGQPAPGAEAFEAFFEAGVVPEVVEQTEPEEPAAQEPIGGWLDRLAGHGANPGGGAGAALMAATGLALAEMVATYDDRTLALVEQTRLLRERAVTLIDEDARASADLALAWRAKLAHLPDTAREGARTSAEILGLGVAALPLLAELEERGNPVLRADIAAAAAGLGAAARIAGINLAANLRLAGESAGPMAEILAAHREIVARLDAVVDRVRG